MARAIIRPIPLYIDGGKLAECSGGTYEINSGDEAHIGTDGYLGHSDGAVMSKLNPKTIVPVKGMKTRLIAILRAKKYVTAGMPVDGQFHQVDMRVITAQYEWDSKTGACTGTFSLEGGEPEITG